MKNALLLTILFLIVLRMGQYAEAPKRSIVDFSEALRRLDVPPRDDSPFAVPIDGPVLVNGRKVRCPFTGSHFVWMGLTKNGTRIVVSRDGGQDYAVFAGSAEANSDGVRVFAINGIREHDPGVKIWQWSDRRIDWSNHSLIHFGQREP